MFNQTEFACLSAASLNHWQYRSAYRGLSYCVYPQHAFTVPDSEQVVRVTRAPKEPNDSGLKFWINAELLGDWGNREQYLHSYLSSSQFRPIDENEFNQLVAEQTRDLFVPMPLPLHPPKGYSGGLAMYTMETDFIVSVFAEYEDEFIHFFWETTA
ncbi:MAG: hypothetical protein V4858_27750 [Pseudomonadota bacterium]